MAANIEYAVEQRRLLRNSRCLWCTLLAVQTDNLSLRLPTQTHQLHYPASITSFSDAITPCRKTAVVL